jgi:hypothetical protein
MFRRIPGFKGLKQVITNDYIKLRFNASPVIICVYKEGCCKAESSHGNIKIFVVKLLSGSVSRNVEQGWKPIK